MAMRLVALLIVVASTNAFATSAPTGCGRSIIWGEAITTGVFGLLLAPATFGDDFEVRLNGGGGGSYRTNIVTFSPSAFGGMRVGPTSQLHAAWSAMGRRRLGTSRFQYRTWTSNRIVTGGCFPSVEGSSRLMAGFSVDALRTEVFQLEVGLAPLFGLVARGADVEFGRVMVGGAPFVRVAVDDLALPVGVELLAFYLLQAGVGGGVLHGSQVDLTFLMRFSGVTITATAHGEVDHSRLESTGGTVLMLSGSILLGVRLPIVQPEQS